MGNQNGVRSEVSRGHSSRMPIVMVGTWLRTEHRTGKNPNEFVNYSESERRSNMRHVVEKFDPNENLLERIFSGENSPTRYSDRPGQIDPAGNISSSNPDFRS